MTILDATVDGVTGGINEGIDVAVTRVTVEALGATGIYTAGADTAGGGASSTVDAGDGSSGPKAPPPFQGSPSRKRERGFNHFSDLRRV